MVTSISPQGPVFILKTCLSPKKHYNQLDCHFYIFSSGVVVGCQRFVSLLILYVLSILTRSSLKEVLRYLCKGNTKWKWSTAEGGEREVKGFRAVIY